MAQEQEFAHGVHINSTAPSEKPSGYAVTAVYDQSPAGRQLGSRTYHTRGTKGRGMNFKLIADVLEREGELENGLDLAQSIVDAIKGDKLDEKTKLLARLELLQYVQPKMKAVEHKGKVDLDDGTVNRRLEYLLTKIGAASGDQPGSAVGGREAGADRALEPGGDEQEA